MSLESILCDIREILMGIEDTLDRWDEEVSTEPVKDEVVAVVGDADKGWRMAIVHENGQVELK
jgi:hypothetical protein